MKGTRHVERSRRPERHAARVQEVHVRAGYGGAQKAIDERWLAAGNAREHVADRSRRAVGKRRALAGAHIERAEAVEQVRAAHRTDGGVDRVVRPGKRLRGTEATVDSD